MLHSFNLVFLFHVLSPFHPKNVFCSIEDKDTQIHLFQCFAVELQFILQLGGREGQRSSRIPAFLCCQHKNECLIRLACSIVFALISLFSLCLPAQGLQMEENKHMVIFVWDVIVISDTILTFGAIIKVAIFINPWLWVQVVTWISD